MACKNSLLRALCTLACLVLAMISGSARAEIQTTVTYYHSDFSGSPVAATSGTGVPLWTTDYLPYGERYDTDEGANNDVWFAGHVEDDPAGLVYMEARYYDPDIGRFHGVDAVGFVESSPHSFNRYSYANNNPYKYVDPDGSFPALAILFVGATAVVATHNAQAPTHAGDIQSSFDSKTVDAVGVVGLIGSLGRLTLSKSGAAVVDDFAKGVEKAHRPNGVPDNWIQKAGKKPGHTKYANPDNPNHDYVRVKPDGTVTQVRNGKALNRDGNPVDLRSPEAHGVTPDKFKFRK